MSGHEPITHMHGCVVIDCPQSQCPECQENDRQVWQLMKARQILRNEELWH